MPTSNSNVAPFCKGAIPILEARYLAKDERGRVVETPEEMLHRVAHAVARAEERWGGQAAVRQAENDFFALMAEGLFLPNSPTLMNAGRPLGQLSACFVLPVYDSLESIFDAVKETALIHKSGGGTGFSFSQLRPAGDNVASTHGVSSGPLSFIPVLDVATEAIKQGGTRRGANMAVLDVSHPDIEAFISAKRRLGFLQNFNLSVMASDAFMEAVAQDRPWPLVNPRNGQVVRQLQATVLFDQLVEAAHASGEPGVLFSGALNRTNPIPALGPLEATNPCGEQPLLPHESCTLGSLCLPKFVRSGVMDYAALEEAATLAIRFLDDVVEVNRYPLPQVAQASRLTRKVGLGVMGFADACIDLGIPYASEKAEKLAGEIMFHVQAAAKEASAALGKQRGNFPAFPVSIFAKLGQKFMRNATVTTIAPTGTLSLILGCSSGIEPLFSLVSTRRVLDGQSIVETNPRFLAKLNRLGIATRKNLQTLASNGRAAAIWGLPPEDRALFETAHEISPDRHLAIQAAVQVHTDNAVSKTVNLPASVSTATIRRIFETAHRLHLKGVTVFRDGCRQGQVLNHGATDLDQTESLAACAVGGGQGQRCEACGG